VSDQGQEYFSTGQVARIVTNELKLDPPLLEVQIQRVLRRKPVGLNPDKVAGRRVWSRADVDRLKEVLTDPKRKRRRRSTGVRRGEPGKERRLKAAEVEGALYEARALVAVAEQIARRIMAHDRVTFGSPVEVGPGDVEALEDFQAEARAFLESFPGFSDDIQSEARADSFLDSLPGQP
jgi:hypothetical protein